MSQNTGGTTLRRGLRILEMLSHHSIQGVTNAEISRALGETPVNVSRALAGLEACGWASRLETGRWTPSMRMLQTAQRHANAMSNAQARLMEINQRVAAGAM